MHMIERLRRIIVISGIGNSGKTSAIKNAAKKLGVHIDVAPKSDIRFAGTGNATGVNFFVGIGSGGDTEETVKENVRYFRNVDLDIGVIVLACKSQGDTLIEVNNFSQSLGIQPIIIRTGIVPQAQIQSETDRMGNLICRNIFS